MTHIPTMAPLIYNTTDFPRLLPNNVEHKECWENPGQKHLIILPCPDVLVSTDTN